MPFNFQGLSEAEARRRLRLYGRNQLEATPKFSPLKLAIKQFKSPLMLILLLALGATLLSGDRVDAGVIFLAILVNTTLGFWQEYRAENALSALNKVLVNQVTVIREGKTRHLIQEEIVKGDLVVIGPGERLAADGVLIHGNELSVNEAILTGEAVAVQKKKGFKVFAGTAVVTGEGVMEVKQTGMDTQMGKIAELLIKTPEAKTPLQKRLEAMGQRLAWLVLLIIFILVVLGRLRGIPMPEMVMVAVAVGVAAIPEGLAISLTAILTVGMRRILKRKALVRKLLTAEVLGSVTVICTDKTGTLTHGVMRVKRVDTQAEELMVTAGLAATGGLDQLEVAFKEWAERQKPDNKNPRLLYEKVLHRKPFSSEKKYSVTLTSKAYFLMGAPELLIGMSAMPQIRKVRELERLEKIASQGYRLVAVLHKRQQGQVKIETNLAAGKWEYLGLVIFEDKVRENLKGVVQEVNQAGIGIKVITGDFRETAVSVMRQIGITLSAEEIVTGEELEVLEPEVLARKVDEASVFARINPTQKLMIVKALQRNGEVVAMTGDGVSDAPALKQADVGIVVSTAADVARETADMVLLDDNFATIVAAIEEGRGMYKNLRKVILYLMADSMTQVLLVVGSLVAGLPLVLTTVQVLWINLVTDSLPALALTVDPHLLGLLDKPPRRAEEAIISKQMGILIGWISVITAAIVFSLFYYLYQVRTMDLTLARTFSFSLTTIACILIVFSCRSMLTPIWKDKILRNGWLTLAVVGGLVLQVIAVYWPVMQRYLTTVAIPWQSWGVMLLLSSGVVLAVEGVKFGSNLSRSRSH